MPRPDVADRKIGAGGIFVWVLYAFITSCFILDHLALLHAKTRPSSINDTLTMY